MWQAPQSSVKQAEPSRGVVGASRAGSYQAVRVNFVSEPKAEGGPGQFDSCSLEASCRAVPPSMIMKRESAGVT